MLLNWENRVCRRPDPYTDAAGWRSSHARRLSCLLSAAALRFSSHPVLARCSPLLRSAYQGLVDSPEPDEVSVFRTCEMRPVSGVLSAPRPWCPRGQAKTSRPPSPLLSGRPYAPDCHTITGAHSSRGFHQGSTVFALPVFPSPVASGWVIGSRDFSRASHPDAWSARAARAESGDGLLGTSPELDHQTGRSSSCLAHSHIATSRRTFERRRARIR